MIHDSITQPKFDRATGRPDTIEAVFGREAGEISLGW
jgi:hypothetical protein